MRLLIVRKFVYFIDKQEVAMLVNRISRSKRVRMKDIAEDLNVSVVTVSKVLRGHADISAATRERVLRRVRELNYEPNVAARSLVTGRSFMIGLVVPGLLHPFFGEVARAITRVVRPKGYSLVIASSEEDPELERYARACGRQNLRFSKRLHPDACRSRRIPGYDVYRSDPVGAIQPRPSDPGPMADGADAPPSALGRPAFDGSPVSRS